MKKQLQILKGLHQGASVALKVQERLLVGSNPLCSVVLCDPGVALKHCLISADDYGVVCRAIDASVTIDGRQIKPGETTSLEDFQLVQCGTATVAVGPVDGDWSAATRAMQVQAAKPRSAMRTLQRLNPYALFAVVMVGITSVIGFAYAAFSGGESEPATSRVVAARKWLSDVAPLHSELAVGVAGVPGRDLLLSGYVVAKRQLDELVRQSKSFHGGLRVEVYAVEEMLAAILRRSELAGVECDPLYKTAGRLSCRKPVASDEIAARIRAAVGDIPGVRSLDVRVSAPLPAVAATTRAPLTTPVDYSPPRLTQRFAVFMFRNERYLIGMQGERYREGDEFDGLRIARIGVDTVIFERDGRQFEFQVVALRTAAR